MASSTSVSAKRLSTIKRALRNGYNYCSGLGIIIHAIVTHRERLLVAVHRVLEIRCAGHFKAPYNVESGLFASGARAISGRQKDSSVTVPLFSGD